VRRGCVPVQLLMAVEMSDNPFRSFGFDGIIGLGLPMLSLTDEFSFFDVLQKSGQLELPQFAVFLSEGGDGDESELSMGGLNHERFFGSIAWSTVLEPDEGHWMVGILAVRVDGETLDICKDGSCRGVIDTGSSHIGIPVAAKDIIHDKLTRDAGDYLDCRLMSSSTLEFELADMNLTLSPSTYMRRLPLREGVDVGNTVVSENLDDSLGTTKKNHTVVDVNATNITRECNPRLMAVDMPKPMGPNLFILGEPLALKYYTIYDWGALRVGFALANTPVNRDGPGDGHGDLPADVAAEGHLLLQRSPRRSMAVDHDVVEPPPLLRLQSSPRRGMTVERGEA